MRTLGTALLAAVLSLTIVAPAAAKDHPADKLDMYSATVDAATAGRLVKPAMTSPTNRCRRMGRSV
jgi:hypothetical protein